MQRWRFDCAWQALGLDRVCVCVCVCVCVHMYVYVAGAKSCSQTKEKVLGQPGLERFFRQCIILY